MEILKQKGFKVKRVGGWFNWQFIPLRCIQFGCASGYNWNGLSRNFTESVNNQILT
jgi:hypothetical protein